MYTKDSAPTNIWKCFESHAFFFGSIEGHVYVGVRAIDDNGDIGRFSNMCEYNKWHTFRDYCTDSMKIWFQDTGMVV